MESEIEKTTVVTLKLNEDEALWLRGLVQNPILAYEDPADEPEEETDMRGRFFEALKKVGPQ